MSENARLVLAVDTSSTVVSAALVDVAGADVQVLAERNLDAGNRHGELLAAAIQDLFAEAGRTPGELVAVAAGLGPGPFTGLRVGVVTAASLADALGVPAYGVCSLDAIAAASAPGASNDFLVCTDARRKQVYWARYDAGGTRVEGPDIAAPADVANQHAGKVDTVIGAGTAIYPEHFNVFALTRRQPVTAADVARLVAGRVRAAAPADVMEPLYLRRPDAVAPGRPKSVLPA